MKGLSGCLAAATFLLTSSYADALTNFCGGKFPLIFRTPVETNPPVALLSLARVQSDTAGNIYFCGTFYGSKQLAGFTLESAGSADGYVAKLTPAGHVEWVRQLHATHRGHFVDLTIDSAGNPVVSGTFFERVQIGTNVVLQGNGPAPQAVVVKYDPRGNIIWAREFGTEAADYGSWITLTLDNELLVCINSDFQTTLTTLNPSGDVLRTLAVKPHVASLAVSSNSIYVASVQRIDPLYTDAGSIRKLDNAGHEHWKIDFSIRSGNLGRLALTPDTAGNLYCAASFADGIYFGDRTFSPGGIAMLKVAPNGAVAATRHFGEVGVAGLQVGDRGIILSVSSRSTNLQFGPVVVPSPPMDASFLAHLGLTANLEPQWAQFITARPHYSVESSPNGEPIFFGFIGGVFSQGEPIFADCSIPAPATGVEMIIGRTRLAGPALAFTATRSSLKLAWPASFSDYQLEQSASLDDTVGWSVVETISTNAAGFLEAEIPNPLATSFFRLRKPPHN